MLIPIALQKSRNRFLSALREGGKDQRLFRKLFDCRVSSSERRPEKTGEINCLLSTHRLRLQGTPLDLSSFRQPPHDGCIFFVQRFLRDPRQAAHPCHSNIERECSIELSLYTKEHELCEGRKKKWGRRLTRLYTTLQDSCKLLR